MKEKRIQEDPILLTHLIERVIEETPQKSVRQVTNDINHSTSNTSVYRMPRFDLKLIPYSVPILQHLKESDIAYRVQFGKWIQEHENIVDKVWFSDEARSFKCSYD